MLKFKIVFTTFGFLFTAGALAQNPATAKPTTSQIEERRQISNPVVERGSSTDVHGHATTQSAAPQQGKNVTGRSDAYRGTKPASNRADLPPGQDMSGQKAVETESTRKE